MTFWRIKRKYFPSKYVPINCEIFVLEYVSDNKIIPMHSESTIKSEKTSVTLLSWKPFCTHQIWFISELKTSLCTCLLLSIYVFSFVTEIDLTRDHQQWVHSSHDVHQNVWHCDPWTLSSDYYFLSTCLNITVYVCV